jgi:hypothetical protein
MTKLELDEITEISDRNGHCDKCGRVIKIYKYPANKQLATILKAMAEVYKQTEQSHINFEKIKLPYELLTQRTKMRLHGLIVRAIDEDGSMIANTWVITTKGWGWLRGQAIPAKVVVFDNQVIGHDGGSITMAEVLGDPEFEQEPISTTEAGLLHDVRKPNGTKAVVAKFVGHDYSGLKRNGLYSLEVDRLQTGRPVRLIVAENKKEYTYKDINEFVHNWHIITEGN